MNGESIFSKIEEKCERNICEKETNPKEVHVYHYELSKWSGSNPAGFNITVNDIQNIKTNFINKNKNQKDLQSLKDKSIKPSPNEQISKMLKCRFKNKNPFNNIEFPLLVGARKILEYMYQSWSDQSICDLILMTRDGEVLTHQILLAYYSPYLQNLFCNQKYKILTFNIPEFNRETIILIIHFLYTFEIELIPKTVIEILYFSEKTHIDILIKLCCDFLMSTLNWGNSLVYLSISINHDLFTCTEACLKYIETMQPIVVEHPHLPILLFKHIKKIIENFKCTFCSSVILELILKWIAHDLSDRINYTEAIFNDLNLSKIGYMEIIVIQESFKCLLEIPIIKKHVSISTNS